MSKKLKKKKSPPIRIGEEATQERKQHGNIIYETLARDINGRAYIKRQREAEECRLDAYLRRGFIIEPLHKAGMKIRAAYLRVHYNIREDDTPRNTVFVDTSTGKAEDAFIAAVAGEEVMREVYKVLTVKQRQIVDAVCGEDEFAKSRAKIKTLYRALEKMAKHWHFM